MKTDMYPKVLLAGLLVLALVLAPAAPRAQDKPEAFKSTAAAGAAGASDPNIKKADATNDPKAAPEKAPSHKGSKTRGFGPGVCAVTVDNWTGWYVKVYVDGSFRGSVGPFDDGTVYVGSGATTVYARADFTDGSYKYWGSRVVNCPRGGTFSWTLNY
jgi:hypothetical protein